VTYLDRALDLRHCDTKTTEFEANLISDAYIFCGRCLVTITVFPHNFTTLFFYRPMLELMSLNCIT